MVHYKGSINKSVVGVGGPHGARHLPGVCSSRGSHHKPRGVQEEAPVEAGKRELS